MFFFKSFFVESYTEGPVTYDIILIDESNNQTILKTSATAVVPSKIMEKFLDPNKIRYSKFAWLHHFSRFCHDFSKSAVRIQENDEQNKHLLPRCVEVVACCA